MTSAELVSHIDHYLDHLLLERRLSGHTVAAYRVDLERLARLLTKPLAELAPLEARALVGRLRSELSPTAIARTLSGWRGFCAYGLRQQWWSHNPFLGLKAPRREKRLPHVLSVEDAHTLLQAEPNQELSDARVVRDQALFELAYSSGLRLSELVGALLSQLDLTQGHIRVSGKGNKVREVPVGSVAVAALEQWLKLRQPLNSPYVFPGTGASGHLSGRTVQLALARWAVHKGLSQHVHPHMLRHSFASHVLQSSGEIRSVQEMLGHASLKATQVYTHLDFQHLAEVYDRAHPRAKR